TLRTLASSTHTATTELSTLSLHDALPILLHIDYTPKRTAAAFALGVFFGFSPFLGLHTLLGVAFAFLLNLNRVAVLLGVYSNLRSEEHTSELQSPYDLVCRLLLEKKKQ